MAVSKMKKLTCAVLADDSKKLVSALQKLSLVEIEQTDSASLSVDAYDAADETAQLSSQISAAKRAIEFLSVYDTRKYSLFDPPQEAVAEDFDFENDAIQKANIKHANELSESIARLSSKIVEKKALLSSLEPWVNLSAPLPESHTAHTVSVCGTLPSGISIQSAEEKLGDILCVLTPATESETEQSSVMLTALNEDFDKASKALSSLGFIKCTVKASEKEGFAAGKAEMLKSEISKSASSLEREKHKATQLSLKLPDIKAYYDVLVSRLRAAEARGNCAATEKTVIITGWAPESAEKKLESVLCDFSAAYSFDEPGENDNVPVALSNNGFARNFEPVLSMYSLPKYGTFDPTMIMSVFYAVIFGLMFADVGYGAVLLAGCLLGLKFLHPKEGLRKMLIMFAFCSVACIIGGVLFGGYFGDLPSAVKQNFLGKTNVKSPAVAFDMIEQPMTFLVVSLVMGAVHLLCGMAIKFFILIKEGHLFDAVFDVGSWFVLFAGIGVYFINSTAGLITALTGALMLVLTQGRHEKNFIMKIAKGLLSLYDIVSYASDLLSYSRILALGLASAVIASVVNLLGTMGGATVKGIILFIFVFLIGHIINFAVNILGTYVHTSRLQYIEFFGKFFEDGGKPFSPLKYETKYVNLK